MGCPHSWFSSPQRSHLSMKDVVITIWFDVHVCHLGCWSLAPHHCKCYKHVSLIYLYDCVLIWQLGDYDSLLFPCINNRWPITLVGGWFHRIPPYSLNVTVWAIPHCHFLSFFSHELFLKCYHLPNFWHILPSYACAPMQAATPGLWRINWDPLVIFTYAWNNYSLWWGQRSIMSQR